MSHPLQILTRFLDHFDDEVQGRQLSGLPGEMALKLQQLASGTLPARERASLFADLRQHPQWIGQLADQVKALRSASPGKSRNSS